jgi:hypothetical protein
MAALPCAVCSVQKHYCRGFLYLCGVEVKWEGLEGLDYQRPVVGMFSHGSNMDPMILASGPFAYKSHHTLHPTHPHYCRPQPSAHLLLPCPFPRCFSSS